MQEKRGFYSKSFFKSFSSKRKALKNADKIVFGFLCEIEIQRVEESLFFRKNRGVFPRKYAFNIFWAASVGHR